MKQGIYFLILKPSERVRELQLKEYDIEIIQHLYSKNNCKTHKKMSKYIQVTDYKKNIFKYTQIRENIITFQDVLERRLFKAMNLVGIVYITPNEE